jgi:hypothetical protein
VGFATARREVDPQQELDGKRLADAFNCLEVLMANDGHRI